MNNRVTYRESRRTFQIFIAPKIQMLQLVIILASFAPFAFFLFRFVSNFWSQKGGSNSLMPLILGMVVWIVSGLFWLYSILLNIFGKEIVTISEREFLIEKSILGRGLVKKYAIDKISYMRIIGMGTKKKTPTHQGFSIGVSIGFSYEGKTHRFGNQLHVREARFMLDRLRNKLPSSVFEKEYKETTEK
jgi:hypothetical protein